jgi:hypothetical protein
MSDCGEELLSPTRTWLRCDLSAGHAGEHSQKQDGAPPATWRRLGDRPALAPSPASVLRDAAAELDELGLRQAGQVVLRLAAKHEKGASE